TAARPAVLLELQEIGEGRGGRALLGAPAHGVRRHVSPGGRRPGAWAPRPRSARPGGRAARRAAQPRCRRTSTPLGRATEAAASPRATTTPQLPARRPRPAPRAHRETTPAPLLSPAPRAQPPRRALPRAPPNGTACGWPASRRSHPNA